MSALPLRDNDERQAWQDFAAAALSGAAVEGPRAGAAGIDELVRIVEYLADAMVVAYRRRRDGAP